MTPTAPTRVTSVLPGPSRHRSPGPRLRQTRDQAAVCPHLPASHSHLHPREHLSLKLETDNSHCWSPLHPQGHRQGSSIHSAPPPSSSRDASDSDPPPHGSWSPTRGAHLVGRGWEDEGKGADTVDRNRDL